MSLTTVPQSLIVQPVVTYGPAFAAYLGSTQTVSSGVYTKLAINSIVFDTNSCFDNVNFKFQPTTAGYYQITGKGSTNSSTQAVVDLMAVYKNGSVYATGTNNYTPGTNGLACDVACLVYMNGTTDYLELFGYNGGSGTNTFLAGASTTFFMGFLARPA